MPRLRLERDGQPAQVFDQDLVTLGRSESNTVVVNDSRVSSVHGEIVRRGPDYYYRDLGSTNGSMVRSAGVDTVVDGRKVREAAIRDGGELHLGDRARAVVFRVMVEAGRAPARRGDTVVTRRAVTTVDELGTQVLDNPLASRQTLGRLFSAFALLGQASTLSDLAARTASQAMGLLPKQAFAACFNSRDGQLERSALVSRDAAKVPLIEAQDLLTWGVEAVEGQEAMAVSAPLALGQRAGALQTLACVPWPGEKRAKGVLLVGREAAYSEFDLDLLALLAHHASIELDKLSLLERLEAANSNLVVENRQLKEALDTRVAPEILGKSQPWKRAMHQAQLVAGADTTVLILGETGTGKELVARHIHALSPRSDRRFAAVNCGALADTLLESELFGHIKGAFTGADRDKPGLFGAADGGTLFLDEIGDVSPSLQVKLLRVLEAGEVTPVGSTQPVHVDVRVLCATHRDLQAMIREGTFREDLYYRIAVFPLELPPLRQRPGDVALLAEHFLRKYSGRVGKEIPAFDPVALARIESYAWPGNVRQLQNEVHRAVVMADDGEPLPAEVLSEQVAGLAKFPEAAEGLKQVMSQLEEQYVRRVLRQHGDNRTQTAKALRISRQALTEKLRRYGLVERR